MICSKRIIFSWHQIKITPCYKFDSSLSSDLASRDMNYAKEKERKKKNEKEEKWKNRKAKERWEKIAIFSNK